MRNQAVSKSLTRPGLPIINNFVRSINPNNFIVISFCDKVVGGCAEYEASLPRDMKVIRVQLYVEGVRLPFIANFALARPIWSMDLSHRVAAFSPSST